MVVAEVEGVELTDGVGLLALVCSGVAKMFAAGAIFCAWKRAEL